MKIKLFAVRVSSPFFLLTLLAGSAALAIPANAQQNGVLTTPKILVINREFTKPGKDGTPHSKTESAYVQAAAAGKATLRYFAEASITGTPRVLFMSSYPSFAAWEAEHKSIDPALAAALDRVNINDGDVLSSTDLSVWTRDDELSLNPGWRVGARFEDIEEFEIRPGHDQQWNELTKLVIATYKKIAPDVHWGAYQAAFGAPDGTYLIISTHKSAAEIDAEFASDKPFIEALGEDGLKKFEQLEAECIVSRRSNLFAIDPKMSYPPEDLVAAEPDFWKPQTKTMAKPMAKKATQ